MNTQINAVLPKELIPEGRITQEALHLEKSISYLGELVDCLEPRIEKILSTDYPKPSTGEVSGMIVNSPNDYSLVAGTFIELRNRVDAISTKLNNILDRVEL